MLDKIKRLLYACKIHISNAAQKVAIGAKTFIEGIKEKGIREKCREEWMFHKNRVISAALVIAFIIIGVMACCICGKVINDSDESTISAETEQLEDSILLDAKLEEDVYLVKKQDNHTTLYKNGEIKKTVTYNGLPVLYFDMNSAEISDEILKMADADNKNNTGGQVYRGKRLYVEQYYSFLLENGYKNKAYIITGSYMDAYFTKNDQTYRFLYIKKTDDTGVLVFGKYNGKIPDSIKPTLKEN